MNKCGNRLVLSSIHIEPVDSHEYNKNLVETLTPYHKQKFLQFVRTERSFLNGNFRDFKWCTIENQKYDSQIDNLNILYNRSWKVYDFTGPSC